MRYSLSLSCEPDTGAMSTNADSAEGWRVAKPPFTRGSLDSRVH